MTGEAAFLPAMRDASRRLLPFCPNCGFDYDELPDGGPTAG